MLQACDEAAHIVGFGSRRDFTHPSQRRYVGFGVNDQQRIELAELVRGIPAEQRLVGLLTRSGAASNAGALNPCSCW